MEELKEEYKPSEPICLVISALEMEAPQRDVRRWKSHPDSRHILERWRRTLESSLQLRGCLAEKLHWAVLRLIISTYTEELGG
jgi:hypothetical protein